jgi:hypothetical protein
MSHTDTARLAEIWNSACASCAQSPRFRTERTLKGLQ